MALQFAACKDPEKGARYVASTRTLAKVLSAPDGTYRCLFLAVPKSFTSGHERVRDNGETVFPLQPFKNIRIPAKKMMFKLVVLALWTGIAAGARELTCLPAGLMQPWPAYELDLPLATSFQFMHIVWACMFVHETRACRTPGKAKHRVTSLPWDERSVP